jgi:hypothetical protein
MACEVAALAESVEDLAQAPWSEHPTNKRVDVLFQIAETCYRAAKVSL